MPQQKLLVDNLLRLEVAKKGQTATYAFFAFALLSLTYSYGCERFLLEIRAISIFLLVTCFIRYFLYRKIIKSQSITLKEWFLTVFLVTINGIGYGVILALAAFELKLTGVHYVVTTTLVAGLVGSSIVTLSYFPILFLPFQSFLLFPQIGIILYYYYAPEHINYLPLIGLYVMFYAYQLKQFKSYRKDLVQLFTYQIELELKNRELEETKDIIIDQTAKLVHASRLAVVGEMSAGIAHEINNPLTIISSCAQMLGRFQKSQEIDITLLQRYVEKIHKSIARISSIVKGLKYFANQGDHSPKKYCNIQDIINETTPFCIDHLHSLNIIFEVEDIPEVMINCHSVQISQVLVNLLKNASDALEANPEATEKDKWISITFKREEDYFYFIVSNGGNKIPQELAAKIFNPFFTTKEAGTGLGLSISQTIMKNHGGELYLDAHNYTNTTFVIKHPIDNYFH